MISSADTLLLQVIKISLVFVSGSDRGAFIWERAKTLVKVASQTPRTPSGARGRLSGATGTGTPSGALGTPSGVQLSVNCV